MKLLLVLLLLMFLPASAAPLSDRTGLVNTLDVEAGGHSFEVRVVGNFDVAGHSFDGGKKRLLLLVDSPLENNIGEIILPRDLLGGELVFYLNGEPLDARVNSNERISFVTLDFEGSGRNELEVFGSTSIVIKEPEQDDAGTAPIVVAAVVAVVVAVVLVKRWTAQR